MTSPRPAPVDDQLARALRRVTFAAKSRSLLVNVALYAAAFAAALGVASVLIVVATDVSVIEVYRAMYEGSLQDGAALGKTLDHAMPILIVALGAVIASRAGIINIGPEGQLLIGGAVGTYVALRLPFQGGAAVLLVLVAAAAGGAAWAGIAAVLRFTRGVDIVITTLLLNFIAFEVISFAVNRSWLLQETRTTQQRLPQSDRLPDPLHLPRLGEFPGFNVSSGIFISLALLVTVAFLLRRSRWGFRLRMLGLNPEAARRAGVGLAVFGGGALVLSGAFAGLAGGVMLTGTVFRMQPGFSSQVGFDGLLAALIARRNPVWTVPVAFFFGALRAGGGFLASLGVPRFLVDVVQSLLVLAALFPPVYLELRDRRRELARARAAAQMTEGPSRADVAVV